MSQICSFSLNSFTMLVIPELLDVHMIQNARTVRIDRLLLGQKGHRRLAAFAEADAVAVARLQMVEDDEVLAVRALGRLQRLEAVRHADDPARAGHARMTARQRHIADDFGDPHIVPQSQMPSTIQRTGEFLSPMTSRAPAPSLEIITRCAPPAPR